MDAENDDIELAKKADTEYVLKVLPNKLYGLIRLVKWNEKVRQAGFKSFNTVARSIQNHYKTIVNFFENRSTNASAESFNRSGEPCQS